MTNKELKGRCLIVTQPLPACEFFCEQLHKLGVVPLHLPSYHIKKLDIQESIDFITPDYVIATSQHVVPNQQEVLPTRPYLAIGPSTASALSSHGITDITQPAHPSSEGLLALLPDSLLNKSVLILTGENPRPLLKDALTERGAHVDYLFCYQRVPAPYTQDTLRHLSSENPLAISVHSGDSLRYLANTLSQDKLSSLWSTPLLLVSKRYEKLACSLGFTGPCWSADSSNPEALIRTLILQFQT